MQRRSFLRLPATLGMTWKAMADTPMPMATLGKSGLQVSRYTVGGYHMLVGGEDEAIRIIRRALDHGVNFFDSARKYHKGRSDEFYGKVFAGGLRQKVLLMSKAEVRDRDGAMRQLEDTLRSMRTDYLDLWQCHEVSTHDDVRQILAPGGSLEAFVKAKQQGKVRHIGFTGHRDHTVHRKLLDSFDGWETVQHPVNLVDPHHSSFIGNFLPEARRKGLGVLAMKTFARGHIGRRKIARIEECLRFAWSQDIDTLVSGAESASQFEQNIAVLKTFQKMSRSEIGVLLHRTKQGPYGPEVEDYKQPRKSGRLRPPHRDGEPA